MCITQYFIKLQKMQDNIKIKENFYIVNNDN